jgi:AmmeMemoRadiSam system protein B
MTLHVSSAGRRPAVAGTFYPADPGRLERLVAAQVEQAGGRPAGPTGPGVPIGLLVPHAGLEYSGLVAAAGWRLLGGPSADAEPGSVVLLGTNHRAGWLDGVAAWERGAWATPLGDVAVDAELAAEVVALGPPFLVDREAHAEEHSLEVQLPFLRTVAPLARIVPLAVSMGTGPDAIEAGRRLGRLLAARRDAGERIVLAISTDMAHYPAHDHALTVTSLLEPLIRALDPEALAAREAALRRQGIAGLACGMCGIEPTVVGLAALRTAGAQPGTTLASATSADAGGPPDRTVGYLSVRFD